MLRDKFRVFVSRISPRLLIIHPDDVICGVKPAFQIPYYIFAISSDLLTFVESKNNFLDTSGQGTKKMLSVHSFINLKSLTRLSSNV